jgi:uncharacterized protein DUF4145
MMSRLASIGGYQMAEEKRFSGPIKCGHCHNEAPMEIVAVYSGVEEYSDDRLDNPLGVDMSWEAGRVYELNKCPACDLVTLRSYDWHSGSMDGSDIEYVVLYPSQDKLLRGLPRKIDQDYRAAQRVRNISANAYGVLVGRLLDSVCEDRDASGKSLDERLKSLADKGVIPSGLVNVAAGIRKLRNIGAHGDLGELTEAEVPVLDDLTRAILEYVYSAPQLAREAEERFAKLKKRKSAMKVKAEAKKIK